MAKRVEFVKVPFNFYWPGVTAVTCVRELGPVLLKDVVADDAVAKGYAVPFSPAPAKPATKPRRRGNRGRNAAKAPADTRQPARVDREDLAAADRADGSASVADAG